VPRIVVRFRGCRQSTVVSYSWLPASVGPVRRCQVSEMRVNELKGVGWRRAGECIMDAVADVAQLVEHHLAKVRVAGSSPVVRSLVTCDYAGHRPFLAWFGVPRRALCYRHGAKRWCTSCARSPWRRRLRGVGGNSVSAILA